MWSSVRCLLATCFGCEAKFLMIFDSCYIQLNCSRRSEVETNKNLGYDLNLKLHHCVFQPIKTEISLIVRKIRHQKLFCYIYKTKFKVHHYMPYVGATISAIVRQLIIGRIERIMLELLWFVSL